MTTYTDKELRKEARIAIREDAKVAGVKAKFIGYSLLLSPYGSNGGVQVTLVAQGKTDAYRFYVNVAI